MTRLPFFVQGVRVGTIRDVENCAGFNRGKLEFDAPHDDTLRRAFQAVVDLARQVDTCEPAEYQECWETWNRGCGELEDLNLWIGNTDGSVEEFNIESDWSVEWRNIIRLSDID
jgi:hypothetical protein